MLKQYKTETSITAFSVNTIIDIAKIGSVKDYAIKNEGTSTILINNLLTIAPQQLISFAGYEQAIKNDNLEISFTGIGTNNAIVIINKIFNC